MRRLALVVLALVATLGLASCTHSDGSSSSAGTAAVAPAGPAQNADTAKSAGAGSAAGGASGPTAPPAQQRAIVRTATLALRVGDIDRAADAADLVATRAGGRVDGDIRSGSRPPTAHLVLRIPASRLEAALVALRALGSRTSLTVQGQDVTATQADQNARAAATATSVARLQALLARSGSLADLLALETQLTQRQGELESMQAQQRALADQVSLASITVDMTGLVAVEGPPPAGGPSGFGSALASGWHELVVGARWVAAVVGYLLPALVVVGAVAALVEMARRHRRSRRRRRALAPAAPGPQQ